MKDIIEHLIALKIKYQTWDTVEEANNLQFPCVIAQLSVTRDTGFVVVRLVAYEQSYGHNMRMSYMRQLAHSMSSSALYWRGGNKKNEMPFVHLYEVPMVLRDGYIGNITDDATPDTYDATPDTYDATPCFYVGFIMEHASKVEIGFEAYVLPVISKVFGWMKYCLRMLPLPTTSWTSSSLNHKQFRPFLFNRYAMASHMTRLKYKISGLPQSPTPRLLCAIIEPSMMNEVFEQYGKFDGYDILSCEKCVLDIQTALDDCMRQERSKKMHDTIFKELMERCWHPNRLLKMGMFEEMF